MNRHLTATICFVSVPLLLAACAGGELDRAQRTPAQGTAFSKALYSGYVDLAKSEYGEGDYNDSDVFAIRAQRAAQGQTVLPEPLADRRLPESKVADLKAARQRLVGALDAGARTTAPENTARAQVMFDCWMQEQEENFQPRDIARCHDGFNREMAAIESKMAPPKVAMPAPKVAPEPKAVTPPSSFVIYFPNGSADLTADSLAVIAKAAATAKKVGAKGLFIGGHTDRSGQDAYNNKLSERRANAVAKAIRQDGVSDKVISLGFFGESKPVVMTEDGVSSPENRRVEIEIRK